MLIHILISALAANYIVLSPASHTLRILKYRWYNRYITPGCVISDVRIKPFDCAPCLSFWLFISLYIIKQPSYHDLIMALAAACVGYKLSKV